MHPRVKICGITDQADLAAALDAAADAVGFLVGQRHPSIDFIEPSLARQLAQAVPPFVATVLVTHEDDLAAIARLAEAVPTQYIQIHCDMSASLLAVAHERLRPRKLIGKVSVEDESSIQRAMDISPVVDAVLVDTFNRATGQVGGTGLTHDWRISSQIRRTIDRPLILAGGLSPDNVREAIQAVAPAAVDVNSGVEEQDGRKSMTRANEFVARARAAFDASPAGRVPPMPSQDVEHKASDQRPPELRQREFLDRSQPSAQGELDRAAEPAPERQEEAGSKLPGLNSPPRPD